MHSTSEHKQAKRPVTLDALQRLIEERRVVLGIDLDRGPRPVAEIVADVASRLRLRRQGAA